jgi:hypothetical protein
MTGKSYDRLLAHAGYVLSAKASLADLHEGGPSLFPLNPARQIALLREVRTCSNLGKAEFPVPNHFVRPSQPQMKDVAMRVHADRSKAREKWN